jgi:signal transduction histidine kinase
MSETDQSQVAGILARQQLLNQRQHKRLARKIHDDVSQKMTLLALQLSLAATEQPKDWEKNCKYWADLVMDLGLAIREITAELQPRVQGENDFVPAFKWLANTSSKKISCDVIAAKSNISTPPLIGNELFSICREVLADFLVPSKVPQVEIQIDLVDDCVRVQLRAANAPGGEASITDATLESLGVQDRMGSLDGTAELTHPEAGGTLLTLTAPIRQPVPCPVG